MRQIGFHIAPGTENQIAVTPTIISTSGVRITENLITIGQTVVHPTDMASGQSK